MQEVKVVNGEEEKDKEEEEEENLPFPTAAVVRLIKAQTGKTMIRSRVKKEMNLLLGRIATDIAKRMAKMPYSYLGYSEFKEAAAPYLKIGLSIEEKKKLVASLNKIKEEAAVLIEELNYEIKEEENV